MIVRVRLEVPFWKPPLFPGSDDAAEQGCSCPVEQPWPGRLDFDEDCPVHQIKRVVH